ncbi:Sodium channel subunit beta-4 [Oryzias melastigma]|uniref:Sodium channel subunit beta-4 n=1 Tax=Oryzias melastigma TaxID=30732 RepID=A0A3B3D3D3_ORYME|nr:sodium channel subunit beta-4 [Oryzias melastigma]KAF6720875.1 Sodium channel subunit beta-4 [Oryzias melastigma]
MASTDGGSSVSARHRSGDLLHAGLAVALLLGVWSVGGLEVTTGKVSLIEAVNGSTVLLPCNYHSCIGIKNLNFRWTFRNNGSEQPLCEGTVPAEKMEPTYSVSHDRVTFVGSSITSNISILLWNITFEDEGQYICFAKNPKEKNRNHSAILTLRVVDQMREVDNTLTVIIVSVLGGVIGLVVIIMVIKALVVHFLLKDDEKNKECLVTSSGNDNTENGLSGAKADKKGTPKA